MDPLLLSNEMCGEGLTETDGGDYRISDCKAGRQIGRGGGALISELLIRRSSSALQKRGGNRASLRQGDHRFLHLHCLLVRAHVQQAGGPRLAGGWESHGLYASVALALVRFERLAAGVGKPGVSPYPDLALPTHDGLVANSSG